MTIIIVSVKKKTIIIINNADFYRDELWAFIIIYAIYIIIVLCVFVTIH